MKYGIPDIMATYEGVLDQLNGEGINLLKGSKTQFCIKIIMITSMTKYLLRSV